MTLTYDDAHLPPDGDVDAAIKNVQKYIRRINYQRKKRGLPNAKYVYVTAYNPDAEIRWHHHIVMDGALDINGNSLMVGGEAGDEAILPLAEFYNKLNNILDKKLDAVQKSNIVYVTNHTYIDGDEVASRTVSRVDAQMVTDKRKGR